MGHGEQRKIPIGKENQEIENQENQEVQIQLSVQDIQIQLHKLGDLTQKIDLKDVGTIQGIQEIQDQDIQVQEIQGIQGIQEIQEIQDQDIQEMDQGGIILQNHLISLVHGVVLLQNGKRNKYY